MANEVQSPPEPQITALVSGIINDAQELFKQQVTLVRSEIRSDFQKTKQAVSALALGVGVAAMAAVLACLALVYLLHWAAPDLPLWACYAIVGGVLAAVGGALIYAGVKKFESFNPLPDQSVEALQENLQWRTNPNPR
jgi:hypothetical protein